MFIALKLFTADDCCGRVDPSTLSQQTRMELLVAGLDDCEAFLGLDGTFTDISMWNGVSFDTEDAVVAIAWYIDDDCVNEERPCETVVEAGGSIDLRWLPPTVARFCIADMELSGTLTTSALPPALTHMNLKLNFLSGSFDVAGLPPLVDDISIAHNAFTGSLDVTAFPSRLRAFQAIFNRFTGSLDLTQLHAPLVRLGLSNNNFTGEIDLRRIPDSLQHMTLHGNAIKQDLLLVGDLPRNLTGITIDNEGAFGKIAHTGGKIVDVLQSTHFQAVRRVRGRRY